MQTAVSTRDYAKYNILVLVISFAVLLAAVFSIIQITDDYKDSRVLIDKAVQWQLRTKGTVALSSTHSEPFKTLWGREFLGKANINTLVLGTSTLMGIRREMFPKGLRVYNYSSNLTPRRNIIGEAYYFVERLENIKWIFIGMDFNLGMVVEKEKKEKYNANIEYEQIPYKDIFADAITLSRLKITFKNILPSLFSNKQGYPCPENDGIGRDFGLVLAPGRCWGFRYDGSATFNYHRMNKTEWKSQLNEKGLIQYIHKLEKSAEKLNESYLNHLKVINDILRSRSGGLILISPPLMPNAEKIILKSAAGKHLENYKNEITSWASLNKVKFIDAGKSEEYGCVPEEFYDAHHALDQCYSKIFDRFFKNNETVF